MTTLATVLVLLAVAAAVWHGAGGVGLLAYSAMLVIGGLLGIGAVS